MLLYWHRLAIKFLTCWLSLLLCVCLFNAGVHTGNPCPATMRVSLNWHCFYAQSWDCSGIIDRGVQPLASAMGYFTDKTMGKISAVICQRERAPMK